MLISLPVSTTTTAKQRKPTTATPSREESVECGGEGEGGEGGAGAVDVHKGVLLLNKGLKFHKEIGKNISYCFVCPVLRGEG